MSSPNYKTAFVLVILTTIIFAASKNQEVAGANGESILLLDFEDDGGSLYHFGQNDPWEWGVPRNSDPSNPGPPGAGDGDKVWATSLDGNYENSTSSYLYLPPLDLEDYSTAELTFLYWQDMIYSELESDEAGEQHPGDRCDLEISLNNASWETVMTYNSTSSASWQVERVDMERFCGGDVYVRFHLIDMEDGFTDNGFYLDGVSVNGDRKPVVDIGMADYFIPSVLTVNRTSWISSNITNGGLEIPPDSYVEYQVLDDTETEVKYRQLSIPVESSHLVISWKPPSTGIYSARISLYVNGSEVASGSGSIKVVDPVYLESGEGLYDEWDRTSDGNSSWGSGRIPIWNPSPSGDTAIFFGGPGNGPGGSFGFEGEQSGDLESGWIDISSVLDSNLYIYTAYDFSGERGSCGGYVQLQEEGGEWELIEPENGYDSYIDTSDAGPRAGTWAFTGEKDWFLSTFDLTDVASSRVRIRFVFASGPGGGGSGWFIDDIMISGRGGSSDEIPPPPVKGLTYQVVEESVVEIAWDEVNVEDFQEYRIYLETLPFSDVTGLIPDRRVVDEDDTTMILEFLSPSAEYWVAVTAVDLSGNEETSVDTVSFRPRTSVSNHKPVARIEILGEDSVWEFRDDIRFSASKSFDPDGDRLTYKWRMPNGKTRFGANVTWNADRAGEDLKVLLEVRDQWGLIGQDSVTVTVQEREDNGLVVGLERDQLIRFIMIIAVLTLIVLILISLAVMMKKRSRRNLERRMEEAGFPAIEVFGDREEEKRSPLSKVVDLTPVEEAEEVEEEVKSLPPKPWGSKNKTLRVALECPHCGETFRRRVEKDMLESGGNIDIKCPHCGKRGNINT